MEVPADWAAEALLSPSKARAQRAQAEDWALVDAWLARRYPRRTIPVFERNEETLQALLALAAANDDTDDRVAAVERVERAVLKAVVSRHQETPAISNDVRSHLYESLGKQGKEACDLLAEASVALDAPNVSALAMASRMSKLTIASSDYQLHLKDLDANMRTLAANQLRVDALLGVLKRSLSRPKRES